MTNKEGVVKPDAGGSEQAQIHAEESDEVKTMDSSPAGVPIDTTSPPPHQPPSGIPTESDTSSSFLRAARSGNLEKIVEYLKGNIDINTCNANGLNALHLAAKEGHVNIVSELLKRGANPNAATKKGNTALHIASLAGKEETAKVLVKGGANTNMQSQNGFTPLYMAAQENHDHVVKFLLANGANQTIATEDGFTPLAVALQQGHDKVVAVLLENDAKGRVRLPALHIAAKKDDTKAAALLLENDHNPDVTSKSGFTPLHIAAHYGNENIASLLLQKKANVNYSAKHHITPLHVAAKWGKSNMVNLLIDKGAAIDTSTKDGLTPLHCAARSGHDRVVDLLLEKGAPITAKTKNGLAPLHMASQGDHVESARILLSHKAPVDDVTVDYLTALHVAAHCGHVRVAKLLLDRRADANSRALNGFTPLHIACKKNRAKVVELLLKHGASIEATTESGLTPLHVASFMGCMNIVITLIQHGANPDVPTVRGETPLHLAARANQADIIRILLRNGAHVDASAREHQTPLHIAARLGNVDIVGLLLQHGAAVDATTKDMYTALHIAAKEGQEEVASVLLDHGASHAATTKKGFTPLHLAAKYGNINVAQLLLQKDAPVDAQGKNGVTPLHVAAHYDHVNVALLLLDKGAHPHATAKNGYTPLHIAAKKNQMDIATTLLEYGAKPSAESKAGFTPLHLAAQEGHTDMTTLLIEHHSDVNAPAKNGLTPLHLCSQEDKVNVAAILVKNSARIDPQTKAGYTPLHVASHFGQINMVRFLIQHGAEVNSTTSHGYTPLHQAAQQGHTLIINLLLEHKASPNTTTNQGQTALSIAQRLGYISVVETLKIVTETIVTTTTTTIIEEKYKVVAPETMQETFMSDSEDEGGEDAMLGGDQTMHYMTTDELKALADDNTLGFDVTRDERGGDSTLIAPLTAEEDHLTPQHVSNQESTFSSSMIPDNVDLGRAPVHLGFLVSFMVDARGGAMRGCRHSGVRVIIPPRRAAMPMRITCRYLRKEKLAYPPPLMDGEACASRILEVGPSGAKFLGPVVIEVPHFASLRGREREIVILRSDNGQQWREHTLAASEDAVNDVLNESFEDLTKLDEPNSNRMTRILTTDFPQYFAIITRIRQDVHAIGPEGGIVSSTVVPQVQAIFPEGALTKKIKVGLQAQPISPELVSKLLGNRVAVSPIVTVEPRRRKFHKGITLTIPVPQAATKGMINQYSGDAPTLRLLCSITGGTTRAQWEDVTGTTPLTFVNDCVSFTTTVSARFWLIDCRQVNEATKFANELYREAIHVPFMAKFVVFAKRRDPLEAQLRVFCMTDDKEDKTLESQEHFTEVAKSRDVEVLEGKLQYLEFAGNLVPVTKSGEQLSFAFQAFRENRLPFTIRVKDTHQDPVGRVAFMREPRVSRGEPPQSPICNLNIVLPEADLSPVSELVSLEKKYGFVQETSLAKPQLIHRADLRLSDIAKELGSDWIPLALQLDLPESDINSFRNDYPNDSEKQALAMLKHWLHKPGSKATGNLLEKSIRKINREDIVNQCMFNVELVTDDVEKAVAKVYLDQSGFDTFKEELGPSRDASLRRDTSLNGAYDEQDMMKEAESAAESSSESSDRDPHSRTHSERVHKRKVETVMHSIPKDFDEVQDTLVQHIPMSESLSRQVSNGRASDTSYPEDDRSEPTAAIFSNEGSADMELSSLEDRSQTETRSEKKEFLKWRYSSSPQRVPQVAKTAHKNTPRYVKSNRHSRGSMYLEASKKMASQEWTMTLPVSNKKKKIIARRNSFPPDSPRKLSLRKKYPKPMKLSDLKEPFWTDTYEWMMMPKGPESIRYDAPLAKLQEFDDEVQSLQRDIKRSTIPRVVPIRPSKGKYSTMESPKHNKNIVVLYFIKKANQRHMNSQPKNENYLVKLRERCADTEILNLKPTHFIDIDSTDRDSLYEVKPLNLPKKEACIMPERNTDARARVGNLSTNYIPSGLNENFNYEDLIDFQEIPIQQHHPARFSLRSIPSHGARVSGNVLLTDSIPITDNIFEELKNPCRQATWNKENIMSTSEFFEVNYPALNEVKKSIFSSNSGRRAQKLSYQQLKPSKMPPPPPPPQVIPSPKRNENIFERMPQKINLKNQQAIVRHVPLDPTSTSSSKSSQTKSTSQEVSERNKPTRENVGESSETGAPGASSSGGQGHSNRQFLRQLFEKDIQSNFSKSSTKKEQSPEKEKELDEKENKKDEKESRNSSSKSAEKISDESSLTHTSGTIPADVVGFSFLKSLIENVEQEENLSQPLFPASVIGHVFLNALVEQQSKPSKSRPETPIPSSVVEQTFLKTLSEAQMPKSAEQDPFPASVIGQVFLKNLLAQEFSSKEVAGSVKEGNEDLVISKPEFSAVGNEQSASGCSTENMIPSAVLGQTFLKTLIDQVVEGQSSAVSECSEPSIQDTKQKTETIPASVVGQAFLKSLVGEVDSDKVEKKEKSIPASAVGQAFLKTLLDCHPEADTKPIPSAVVGQTFLKSLSSLPFTDSTPTQFSSESSIPANVVGQSFLKALIEQSPTDVPSPIPAPVVSQAFLKSLITERDSVESPDQSEKIIPASVVSQSFLKSLSTQEEQQPHAQSQHIPSSAVTQFFLKTLLENDQAELSQKSKQEFVPSGMVGQVFLKSLLEEVNSQSSSESVSEPEKAIPSSVVSQSFLKLLIDESSNPSVSKDVEKSQTSQSQHQKNQIPASVIGQAFLKTLSEQHSGSASQIESISEKPTSEKTLPANVIGQAFLHSLVNLMGETSSTTTGTESTIVSKEIDDSNDDHNNGCGLDDVSLLEHIIPPPPGFCSSQQDHSVKSDEPSTSSTDVSGIIEELLACTKTMHSMMEHMKDSNSPSSSQYNTESDRNK